MSEPTQNSPNNNINTQHNQDPCTIYGSHFYIHPSDTTIIKLVPELFNGTGFIDWKRSIMLSLSPKNKLCFIDGSLPEPPLNHINYAAWHRCNDMVKNWLHCSLVKTIAKSVYYCKTAAKIWNDLEERYGQAIASQLYSLRQSLLDVKQESDESVADFYTKIKSIWDEIDMHDPLSVCSYNACNCTSNKNNLRSQQARRVMLFLMKLIDDFKQVRSNVLMIQPLPPLNQVYRMCLQEENQKAVTKATTATQLESMAFAVDRRRFTDPHKYGKDTYPTNNYNTNSNIAANKMIGTKRSSIWFCDHCKISGHSIERCYKLHGYPNTWNKDKKSANLCHNIDESDMHSQAGASDIPPPINLDQYNQLMSLLSKNQNSENNNTETPIMQAGTSPALFSSYKFCMISCRNPIWILDSGATDHICHDLSLFSTYTPLQSHAHTITIPDGRQVAIKHIGYVLLPGNITLRNVFHVPDFHYNLISIHKLCLDLKCDITFSASSCMIQGPHLTLPQVLGNLHQGLYCTKHEFQFPTTSVPSISCHAVHLPNADLAKLWHLRLGHLPFPQLQTATKNIVTCPSMECICQICPIARQIRSSFSHSTIKTTQPFELIHVDIWGPYTVPTYTKCNFFLTIVDDYSRHTWVHFLKYKSDDVSIMKNFVAYSSTQFQLKIKTVRCDNAKELTEGEILQYYFTQGIVLQKTCVDTPQQNGIVERKHRHLLETARALFFQSKLPISYWNECVLTATHLINRTPLKSINNISPYEKLYGKSPSLHHL